MGLRMARRLVTHGHAVTVWNRTPRPLDFEANLASTPAQAAEGADLVLSMLTDAEASQTVWLGEDGAASGLKEGAVALECSTLTPQAVQALAAPIQAQGARLLEAPVVGTRPHAEGGTLTFLVGGDAEVLAHVEPVLQVLGGATHHTGPIGSAATVKLAVNTLFAVQTAAWAEAVELLRRAGQEEALDVLLAMPVASAAVQGVVGQMRAGSYAPLFPIGLVEKDLRYALAVAEAGGVAAPLARAAHAQFAQAVAQGYGEDNLSGVIQTLA